MPRRSEPPLSSATTAPGAAGQEAGVWPAHVKTNRALPPSNSRRRDRGPLPSLRPKGQMGNDPWNGGRHPWNRTGAKPRTGFQVPYTVFLNTDRHLKLSEVDTGDNRRRLQYFSTWTSAVTSLLHVYGRIPFPVAESVASITVVALTCPVLRRAVFFCHLRGVPCLRGGAFSLRLEEQKLATRVDNTIGCQVLTGVGFFSGWMFMTLVRHCSSRIALPLHYGKSFQHERQSTFQDNRCLEECEWYWRSSS